MKYPGIIVAAVLFTLHADLARAQVITDRSDDYQHLDRSGTIERQWGANFTHNNNSQALGFGLVFDSDGAVGPAVFLGEWMVDIMLSTDYDNDVFKLKGGRSFMIAGDRDFNFNLYGMAGYRTSTEQSGGVDETVSGLMLEGGTLFLFTVGDYLDLAFGAGYNYDTAIEEEYYTIRAMFLIGY